MKKAYSCIGLCALLTLLSCKKDKEGNSEVVQLNAANSGGTIQAVKGETINLTLGNPGDGGYQFNAPKYDGSVLSLTGHIQQTPSINSSTGNFGQDVWTFTTIKAGKTLLAISASRESRDTVTMFSNQIVVK